MARILCIEDSKEFQIYLSSVLREHTLVHIGTLGEAARIIGSGSLDFDLVLMDISLPDGNGMKALPNLKEAFQGKQVPFIVVSSDSDVLSKVAAFGVGADDYISKPPDSSELRARVEAKIRWINSNHTNRTRLLFEDLLIDIERVSAEIIHQDRSNSVVDLTPLEFKVLKLLMGRPGQVFSRETIIDRAWGVGRYITPRTIDAHISHIRNKIKKSRVQVETVLTEGYKITKKHTP